MQPRMTTGEERAGQSAQVAPPVTLGCWIFLGPSQAARRVERRRVDRRGPRRGVTATPSRRRRDGASAVRGAGGLTSGAGGPVSALISAAPGLTRAITGLTPACRVSVRTAANCSGVDRVTTTPSAPALAVRPERCRYALHSDGGSTCTTRPISSTWRPRATMSVATSTRALPSLKRQKVPCPGVLREVPVQLHGGQPGEGQLLGELRRGVLGASEQQAATLTGGQLPDY